MVEVVIYMTKV